MPESLRNAIPKGFHFSVAEAAIKKPGRKDLALIVSEVSAAIAGTFTTNTVKAAPVKICMQKIRTGKGRAIVINSGNANACTGIQGIKNANDIVSRLSGLLGIQPSLIYPCSTGVIGTPMPMERIIPVLQPLAEGTGKFSFGDVAKAIMTTDTFPKMVSKKVRIGKKTGTIAGICKGAGMIAPNMATMLCFLITDIAIDGKTLPSLLKHAVKKSFNCITIDGDMSTNDTVLLLANGMLGNSPVTMRSAHFRTVQTALDELTYGLSRLVVKDAEGATKLIEVVVKGARSESAAEKAAFSIANSSLVKTAVYGNDANWGRIMAALGYSGVIFNEARTDIYFNKVKVVKSGVANNKDAAATEALKSPTVRISVDFHAGRSSAKVLTCDLTEEYIRINAEYRT